MLTWENRPIEVANLLNPSFCALLLRNAVQGFEGQSNVGMPYPLLFLVLPIILHSPTRVALPARTITKQHVWIQDHPEIRVGVIERIRQLVPYTKEALMFGLQSNSLILQQNAALQPVRRKVRQPTWSADEEAGHCVERAQFLGRWFAGTGDVSTIFVMWGIRP